MKLLMLSGDRATTIGEKGPFYYLQESFSQYWDRVDVLCPKPDKPVSVRTIHGRVHFWPSEGGRLGHVGYLKQRGLALLAEHRHDVIVSHDYGIYSNGRAAAKLAQSTRTPWMSELFHVPGVPRAADLRERFDPWITRRFVRFAMGRGVSAFRVMNHREMPVFLQSCGVPEEKIRYVSALYLDLATFSPKAGVEKRYDVAFVGRMVPNKGVANVLEALGMVKGKLPAVRAVFVGKGPLRPELEARARSLGLAEHVTWIDWLATKDDVAQLYRESKIVVCASYNEGGPRFTCEAMACGTPVVSTPIGVMPDLVRHGENGWLFEFDAPALARALEEALCDGARYAKAAARCREAVEPFEKERMIERYAKALQSVARREPVAAHERVTFARTGT